MIEKKHFSILINEGSDIFKSLKTVVLSLCLITLTQACENNGENLIFGSSTSKSIFSSFNSEIQVSSTKVAIGEIAMVTLSLKNDHFASVYPGPATVRFYSTGGTATGYFGTVSDLGNGTYTVPFTALSGGTANIVHARVNDDEILSKRNLPGIAVSGGPAQTMLNVAGNLQSGPAAQPLPLAFYVVVRDASETPLPATPIDWTITSGSGSLSYLATLSDANGLASTQLTLGSTAGPLTVVATARGTAVSTTFTSVCTSTPFTQSWLYSAANSSDYTFDPAKIEFSGGVCRLIGVTHLDQNNTTSGFGGGALAGIVWDSNRQALKLGSAGACDGSVTNCSELNPTWGPQWSNLVGYWKFNGPTGPVTNGTTIPATVGPSGTAINASAFNYVSGKSNQALNFATGANDMLVSSPLPITDKYTFTFWVNLSSFPSTLSTPLSASNTGAMKWILNFNAAYGGEGLSPYGLSHFYVSPTFASSSVGNVFGTSSLNGWHHIALSYDAGATPRSSFYIDGTQVGTNLDNVVGNFPAHDAFYVGGMRSDGNGCCNTSGSMDELAVWKSALSASDVRTIYNRQAAKFGGYYASRVMDALAPGQPWTSLSWKTSLPFGKELPDYASGAIQNESSTDYPLLVGANGSSSDNNLMSGIVGLWHLDETSVGTAPNGTDFKDSSGKGNNGTKMTGVNMGSSGKFKSGIDSPTGGYVQIPNSADYDFTTGYSVSIWAKPTTFNPWNVLVGKEIWSNSQGWFLFNDTNEGRLFVYQGGGGSSIASANGIFTAGKWHHVVYTNSNGSAKIYLDGTVVASGTVNISNSSAPLLIGARHQNNGSSYTDTFKGSLDEVGLWSRALNPAEVTQLYQRGINQVSFQVRNCATADCSDDANGANWKGPNGTNQTYFNETNNTTIPNGNTGLVKSTLPNFNFSDFTNPPIASRYFQYRTFLESDDGGFSPELKSVSIGPSHFNPGAPTVVTNTGATYLQLSTFVETLGTSCAAGVGYNVGAGVDAATASWYYWAASKASDCVSAGSGAWCVSDGTSLQANPAASIATQLPTLFAKTGFSKLFVKAYLQSSGTTGCELQKILVSGQH